MMAHVLDAARDCNLGCAHRDLARRRRHRGQRAGTHAVDGETGHRLGDPCEQPDVAAEREALISDLRRRGHDDVADPLRRHVRIPTQQLAHDLHCHVVRARTPEDALLAGAPERRSHAVEVDDVSQLTTHAAHSSLSPSGYSAAWTSPMSSRGNSSATGTVSSASARSTTAMRARSS
jgi:hypothetical protein